MLAYLPVETVIKSQQQMYYQTLGEADQAADCSGFIVFLLTAIENALKEAIADANSQETTQETTQEKIIVLLSRDPTLTRQQLAERLSISADGVKYNLQKLKANGRIKHIGPTKSGYWRVLK